MDWSGPHHFVTGDFTPQNLFLSDEDYAKVLDCVVKAVTDLIITNEDGTKILLGKRKVHPQPDWWMSCGGRMKPGETPCDGAARIIKRELGIELDKVDVASQNNGGRFIHVATYSFVWNMREQLPKENGTADVSWILSLALKGDEIKGLKSDPKEYEKHEWFLTEDLLENKVGFELHPALEKAVKDLVLRKKQMELEIAANDSTFSDSELAAMMRNIFLFQNK